MGKKKETSSRVSTLAAKLLRSIRGKDRVVHYWCNAYGADIAENDITRQVKQLCASLISQDETPGQAKKKRRGRK